MVEQRILRLGLFSPEKRGRRAAMRPVDVRELSRLRLMQLEGKLQSVAAGCFLPSLPCLSLLTSMRLQSQEGQQGSAGAQDYLQTPK